METSQTLQSWTTINAAVPAASSATQTTFLHSSNSDRRFYRVSRTTLNPFDPAYNGQ
jgi:hypothetical protein